MRREGPPGCSTRCKGTASDTFRCLSPETVEGETVEGLVTQPTYVQKIQDAVCCDCKYESTWRMEHVQVDANDQDMEHTTWLGKVKTLAWDV